MAGHRLFDAMMLAKSYGNIFLDISFTFAYFKGSSIERDVFFVIKKLGSNRCIYGSDHPQRNICDNLDLIKEDFEKYSFSVSEQEDIFYNTIAGDLRELKGLKICA